MLDTIGRKGSLSIQDTNQFMKLGKNPRSSYESKMQGTLRKVKSKLSTEEYNYFLILIDLYICYHR